jgi:hypothetical protein
MRGGRCHTACTKSPKPQPCQFNTLEEPSPRTAPFDPNFPGTCRKHAAAGSRVSPTTATSGSPRVKLPPLPNPSPPEPPPTAGEYPLPLRQLKDGHQCTPQERQPHGTSAVVAGRAMMGILLLPHCRSAAARRWVPGGILSTVLTKQLEHSPGALQPAPGQEQRVKVHESWEEQA